MNPPQVLSGEREHGKADIHIHSIASDGMASVPDILEFVARRGDIDVIAITDHDEIRGSYQARELAAKHDYPFEVVIGMEVNTLEGHLIGLFIEDPIPRCQSLETSIAAIHTQDGLCIVPHPMSWLTDSVGKQGLERIMGSSEPDIYFDGIETINATIVGRISNWRAKKFNRKYNLAETGGSDAHFLVAVGSGLTVFPGRSAHDLRKSIVERTSRAQKGNRVSYFDIGIMQIIKQQHKSRGFFIRGMLKSITR